MKIQKKFLIKNKSLNINFNNLRKIFILNYNNSIDINQNSLNLNYFHYQGFVSLQNKYLIFRNKISLLKIYKRINSFIKGFLKGFCLILEIIGLGFSITNSKNLLRFNIGYNHSIFYSYSDSIKICAKRRLLFLFSFSYFDLKKVVIDLKNFRKLNVYKLKGIKEKNELYIKKNWKKKVN